MQRPLERLLRQRPLLATLRRDFQYVIVRDVASQLQNEGTRPSLRCQGGSLLSTSPRRRLVLMTPADPAPPPILSEGTILSEAT